MKLQDIGIQGGLSTHEIELRIQKGEVNHSTKSMSKSNLEIIQENICTLFNLLNFLIAAALMIAGAWTNLIFIFIILFNILIGIVQELHAKKLVNKLSLLMVPFVQVLRNGEEIKVKAEELVLDDIMILKSGDQICCDALLVEGSVEVNEALLTGESDPQHKHTGKSLLSGSSIISGRCCARVVHVGDENYALQIANEVKQQRSAQSELMKAMRKVTKYTSLFLILLGICLLCEAFILRDNSFHEGIVSVSAALLGMLPKGLVLLISISLAAGVTRLAKKNILVQDLYSLETLAHVDTLCLDKTGTITNGSLEIEKVIPMAVDIKTDTEEYLASFLYHSKDVNATYEALCLHFPKKNFYIPDAIIPFSSARKYSAAHFPDYGALIIGAPDRLLEQIPEVLKQHMQDGKRVIVIAHGSELPKEDEATPELIPLYAIIMKDSLRLNIQETLAAFYEQGVDIKVISGDHVLSVSAIAKEAGIVYYDHVIDMSNVSDSMEEIMKAAQTYTVFGRVTPKQKKMLVQALQMQGHCVAMTGDGVNDMLAMKEADCSISVAQGSDAVKQMSQIVLLDSDFSALSEIVLEGRRVINNITRVAGIFFIKTLYSIALTLFCVFLNLPFPFIPIQITLIDALIEAFPSFLSILECDTSPIRNKFLPSVLRKAYPNALAIMLMIITIYLLNLHQSNTAMITMMYLGIAIISMQAVIRSCLPMTWLRFFICTVMVGGCCVAVLLFPNLLELSLQSKNSIFIVLFVSLCAILVSYVLDWFLFQRKNETRGILAQDR